MHKYRMSKTPDRRKRVMRSGAPMRRSTTVMNCKEKRAAAAGEGCPRNWDKPNKGGRPRKDTVELTVRVPPDVRKLFQEEAESRGLTLGELFEEICRSRVTLIDRRPSNV